MTVQDTTTETETSKNRIATHEWLGPNGGVVDDIEDAIGYQYKLLVNGETFNWLLSQATDSERNMCALFGVKTLCTNEVSGVRNSKENRNNPDPTIYDDAIEAVRTRFALIRNENQWERTREATVGVPRVDRDKLAEAICQVLVKAQKKTQQEVDDGYKATVRQRLDDDAEWLGKMRKFPPVLAAYTLLVGKDSGITVDSMLD
jgi:hypothetical protein